MIKTDSLTRKLYAQDASMYQEEPKGASFPKTIQDIQELVLKAQQEKFSITARSAGTSLAGQATGGGVILDVSRNMTELLSIDIEEQTAVVQPGVIRDSLNRGAGKHGLLFGPDTSTTNRCMIGGMIGNNSSGSFSIKYKTTREHVKEMEVVLSDGSIAHFKPLSQTELDEKLKLHSLEGHIYRAMIRLLMKNKDLIRNNYPHPEITRRNTGYALDKLCEMKPIDPNGRPFNLCELLCGSEGTLALTASAKVNLEKLPRFKRLIIPQFSTLDEAMRATVEAVKLEPSAVELIDDIIMNATKGNIEHIQNRFFLEGDPKCILIIQFEGDSEIELEEKTNSLAGVLKDKDLGYAFPQFSEQEKMDRVWNLRKAGLGLLMGLGKDSRSPTFCEDTAVRVSDLPGYVKEFQRILEKHNTNCVFYAHASVGELHIRPVIDTTTQAGVDKMKTMAEEVAGLVGKYRGSLSGEHGDGRARSPYIEKVLGKEMMPVLEQVKEIWDPNYIFNPGKIIKPKPIDENLRFSPSYTPAEDYETIFNWRKEGSLTNAIELCNGAGVCRKLAESGGTMCPSYMATADEKDSTRGRANVFRQVFSGENPETFESEELKEALDLCLSCKACKSECPANVDMARMKAEFMNGWHEKSGVSFREHFFGSAGKLYPLAAQFTTLSNWMVGSRVVKQLLEDTMGISAHRTLPLFAKQTFKEWFRKRKYEGDPRGKQVVLFVDLFINFHEPEIAISAVKVLEEMGFRVMVPDSLETGRPQISKGLLKAAKRITHEVIEELHPFVEQDIPIVGLEPSEILTLRDEFLDLCSEEILPKAEKLASMSFTFEEFLANNKELLPESTTKKELIVHGHCYTKALIGNEPTKKALEAAGFKVDVLDTGCCGMAGSFGYEKEHYDISMEIGGQRLFPQVIKQQEKEVCAPGFSCRHQIKDGTGKTANHPATLIANKLNL